MTTIALNEVHNFGNGVMQAEGVVVDKDGFVYGGGRNAVMYKVSPDGEVSEIATLPEGSIPNGITMDRNGDIIYCDLGKQAMFRMTQSGQVSFIADHVGDVKLALPNFACYDAEGNLYVSNTSTRDLSTVLPELSYPEPNGAASAPTAVATWWRKASTPPTEWQLILKRRPCTCWKAPGTTAYASP